MLISDKLVLKWNNANKKHFTSKGYIFTKNGDGFEINVKDLAPKSSMKVKVKCDSCIENNIDTIYEIMWSQYRENKKDICEECKCIIGKTFGKLTVLNELEERNKYNEKMFLCQCSCENKTIIKVNKCSLITGNTSTCGCGQKEHMKRIGKNRKLNLQGKTFNRLTLIEPTENYSSDGKIIWKCICECGNIAYLSGSKVKRGLIKSCGCIRKAKGKKHFNYNPNLTDEERALKRYGFEYKEWRNDIFERDNYICQCCKKRGGDINAHHIFSYKKYEDLRLQIENGISLCEDCHTEFHQKYGYKDFTPENFQEFFYFKTGKYFNLDILKQIGNELTIEVAVI
ncbi:HNH endonuclease [Metabacillus fastidiosus]|uniref:HNH endonuclease n=1 Tax=Metabacillus fastidiosus TaxID=1458 RepID=UPI003D2D907D